MNKHKFGELVSLDRLPAPAALATPEEDLKEFADYLRSNPGMYGKFPREGSKSALSAQQNHIKRGRAAWARPEGAFDAKIRNQELWVAYIGEADEK